MATDSIQCPVCGEQLSAYTNFCPSCSFEIHILPNDIPNALREMEEQRVRYAKNTYLSMKSEIARLQTDVEQKTTEIINAKASYEGRITTLEGSIATLEGQYRETNEQLSRKLEEVAVLNQQNKELQEAIEAAQAAPKTAPIEQPLAFLVMMQNDSVSAIFGIREGENTFGFAASHDQHHQIICDATVSDIHFMVKADSTIDPKGRKRTKFSVTSCGGNIFGAAHQANLISGESPFEKNSSIYIDDVKFTLVANKEAK